jgi:osmotically-inducible protein OsmY
MDTQLEDTVRSALQQNPRISNPRDFAISAAHGTVTLRGTMPSFKERRIAVEAARNVRGVHYVADELTVRLVGDDRSDDQLRGEALQALIWDVDVPADAVDVKVRDGWVTLKGEVKHQFQSDAAFDDVERLEGVDGITNEIRVVTA